MPKFDGTGPRGKGPKTGRGLGKCVESKTQNNDNSNTPIPRGLGRNQMKRNQNSNRGNS